MPITVAAARPEAIIALNSQHEYTAARLLGDAQALANPMIEERIGRKVWDILPGPLAELYLKNLYYALRDKCHRNFHWRGVDGSHTRGTLLAPNRDHIIVTIHKIGAALILMAA